MPSCLFNGNRLFHANDKDAKYKYFCSNFSHVSMERKAFLKNLKRFVENSNKKEIDKESFIKVFSADMWEKIPQSLKIKHTLNKCKECCNASSVKIPKTPTNQLQFLTINTPSSAIFPICLTDPSIRARRARHGYSSSL